MFAYLITNNTKQGDSQVNWKKNFKGKKKAAAQ